jgi:hypothetical protein
MCSPWWQCHEAAVICVLTEFKCNKPFLIVSLPKLERLFLKTLLVMSLPLIKGLFEFLSH